MAVIRGTKNQDTLIGGAEDDLIRGLRGRDSLLGVGGDDTLAGARGSDTLDGGASDDVLRGGAGSDLLSDSQGSNRFFGGQGDDTVTGVSSATVQGQAASVDRITLGRGNDTLLLAESVLRKTVIADIVLDFDRRGDVIDFGEVNFKGASAGTDLFAEGYLRLTATEDGSILESDRNGGGDRYRTILVLEGIQPEQFRDENFSSDLGYIFNV